MTTQTKTTWRKVKLGEVVEIIDGDRGRNYPGNGEFLTSGYSVFLNTKNIPGTKFDFNNAQFISKKRDSLLRKGRLERGDFVLTTRGTIGNIAYYGNDVRYDHIRINSGMVILRPKRDIIDERFLNLFLVGQEFKNQATSLQSGSAQPQLPIRDLRLFEINLPSLGEQSKISDMLWPLDDKIELNNKISRTLEEMAQAIFKEWFVESSKVKNQNVRLEEIAEIIKGKKPRSVYGKSRGQDTEYLLIESFTANNKLFTDDKNAPQGEEGDVVIVMDGASSGRVFRGRKGAIGSTLAAIKPKPGISREFLFLLLKRAEPQLMDNLTGSAIPHLDKDFLKTYPVSVPAPDVMEKFTAIARPISQRLVGVETENQKLAALRDLLLPKLMSGGIRA